MVVYESLPDNGLRGGTDMTETMVWKQQKVNYQSLDVTVCTRSGYHTRIIDTGSGYG